jgi:hypothetical protein
MILNPFHKTQFSLNECFNFIDKSRDFNFELCWYLIVGDDKEKTFSLHAVKKHVTCNWTRQYVRLLSFVHMRPLSWKHYYSA